jgi:hypothetical protein
MAKTARLEQMTFLTMYVGDYDIVRAAIHGRLQERDAYRAHVMVPFGELYGRLDF